MLGPARGAAFLQRIWRKLTYALPITIIIPVLAIFHNGLADFDGD
jgi:hypothetical protein